MVGVAANTGSATEETRLGDLGIQRPEAHHLCLGHWRHVWVRPSTIFAVVKLQL